jgi:hypothetical protein
MGGRSRSRTSTTQQEILTTQTDNRVAQDGGDIGGNITVTFADTEAESTLNSDNVAGTPNSGSTDGAPVTGNQVNIQTSDFGVLNFAEDFVANVLESSSSTLERSQQLAEAATRSATQNAENVLETSREFVESDSTEIVKVIAVVGAIVAVAIILKG